MRILLTGATGFIGKYILELLLQNRSQVMCLCRSSSKIDVTQSCQWLNIDNRNWMQQAKEFAPEVIIHTAWSGVGAVERGDWIKQIENITIQQYLLELKPRKIIALGSQAEYGTFDAIVNENFPVNPNTAYGAVKVASLDTLRFYCQIHNIQWHWFRLFSVFGQGEGENWLIPSSIKKMKEGGSMDFTAGEQRYSYLYVGEVARIIVHAANIEAPDGVYNLSSATTISIRELLEKLRDYIRPSFQLNFGALPYRLGQSMLMGGDNTKLSKNICTVNDSDFDERLKQTVESYK